MVATAMAIQRAGLVTSVGLDSPSACAAMRAKLTNPTQTHFMDTQGDWMTAHEVPLEAGLRGLDKLVRMAAMAIEECLRGLQKADWQQTPLLLCIAERDRPGRQQGLDDRLFSGIEELLGSRFAKDSAVIAEGRVGVAVALAAAHRLLYEKRCERVLIAGTDSLLSGATLNAFERAGRLLNHLNSNGFMPGEAAGALLVTRPSEQPELRCIGIGFGMEKAHLESGLPLRGDGLCLAVQEALTDAGSEMHDMDFRIADCSGEQYYFKEASLTLTRTLRRRKETFGIWHPAECTGETGAASGLIMLTVALESSRKCYSLGDNMVAHFSNDSGQRAAAILQFSAAT